jgi:hypothetical protein
MSIQCSQLNLVLYVKCNKYLKSAHTYKVAASLYIVAAMMMTSALLLISYFERERAQRFTKQAYRCYQWLKTYQKR